MTTPAAPTKRRPLSTTIGIVTSDKRDKTRKVAVEYQEVHPKYGKRLRREQTFHVHDEENASGLGDRVEIARCRPLSKTKTFRLVRIVEKAPAQVTHATTAPIEPEPETPTDTPAEETPSE